jgi:23S rRNA (guanosine2251-2'-O)-methyltransferase
MNSTLYEFINFQYSISKRDAQKIVENEILYGINPVYEALVAARRRFFKIHIERKKLSGRLKQLIDMAETQKIPIKKMGSSQIDTMVGCGVHQGVTAKVSRYPLVEIQTLLALPGVSVPGPRLLLLDNIQDPHNLGAIIRTASCIGIDGVVIPKDRSVSPTATVSKASAGALEHIQLARVTNMVRTVKMLKDHGFWIIGLDQNAPQSMYATDLKGPIALVIGGEQKGIRPLVRRNCDMLISIPQCGPIGSLNASVAGAIVMYESFRQRQHAGLIKT